MFMRLGGFQQGGKGPWFQVELSIKELDAIIDGLRKASDPVSTEMYNQFLKDRVEQLQKAKDEMKKAQDQLSEAMGV